MLKYEAEIRGIIDSVLGRDEPVDRIDCNTNLQDIGMDSLAFVEIVIKMEEQFNIEIPIHELVLSESGTIASLCRIVDSVINKDQEDSDEKSTAI